MLTGVINAGRTLDHSGKVSVKWLHCYILSLSLKRCNYDIRVSLITLYLTKFLVNSIHIYGFKLIYYKNTFYN